MALIPLDPDPRPHRFYFIAGYVLCMLAAMLVGGALALLQFGWRA